MKLEGMLPSVQLRVGLTSAAAVGEQLCFYHQKEKNTDLLYQCCQTVCHIANPGCVVRVSRNQGAAGRLHRSAAVPGKTVSMLSMSPNPVSGV